MLRTDLLTLGALHGSQINQEEDKIGLRFKRSMNCNMLTVNHLCTGRICCIISFMLVD
ncbi:MAG: hypothetical protein JWP57_4340 [Spirosoma sp.]|nr:hypothetical protein [Spirosoma sp.]